LSAIELFEAETKLHDILGNEFAELFVAIKQTEADEFLQVISPWEREHLMLNV